MNNEFELELERANFFCWTVRLVYNRTHGENGFFITFSPSAFPETSFLRSQRYYDRGALGGQAAQAFGQAGPMSGDQGTAR